MTSTLTSSPSGNNSGYFCLWACPGYLLRTRACFAGLLLGLGCSVGSALIGGLSDYCGGKRRTVALSFQIKSTKNVCISKRKRKVKKFQKFLPNANTSWFLRFNSP
ncbi:unnamed protein product [Prunus armeniaca]